MVLTLKAKIIILTGNELRHKFFRKVISSDHRINVIKAYCEKPKEDFFEKIKKIENPKTYLDNHLLSRWQNELNYFQSITDLIPDNRPVKIIEKGKINDIQIVSEIINHNPDLIFCYGSSLIKSELIRKFRRKFVNIHLGLSPYYREQAQISGH